MVVKTLITITMMSDERNRSNEIGVDIGFCDLKDRLYGYVLRSASDVRETYMQWGNMPHQARPPGYVTVGSIPWSNPTAACFFH
ncbi:hypothetical protein SUGI_0571530 [Cryptomeria japonica]|nr:hypothetical protein SUGI_0571530 [Cryptomeria japonica]